MKTIEQIKGTKFEIWLEKLLKEVGCQDVLRNVEFHRTRYRYRQVDLSYSYAKQGNIYRAVVEAKFSSNGKVRYALREPKSKKESKRQIEFYNLVDEVIERQRFVNAGLALLITNHKFEKKVKKESAKYGIRIIEGKRLTELYREQGHEGTIDQAIESIDLKTHNLDKNIIYLS